MSFVFPFLLGGIALAGIPVLIHLIMRQKPRTLPFPAFRFLVQRHRTNLHKLRLRHLLLLSLRILLIAGIVLALARPQVMHQGLALGNDRPVAAVLVFDTSPTMDYRASDGETRLAEAKKRALELIDQLPEGSRVAIVETDDLLRGARPQAYPLISQARERIAALAVKGSNGPVTAILDAAYRQLASLEDSKDDERARQLPRLLFVFSDRTRACWDAARTPMLRDAANRVPPTLAGLRQSGGQIGVLTDLLKELRQRLPPTAGQDYPEQALLEYLAQFKDVLPRLTADDLPPDRDWGKTIDGMRQRSRELIDLLGPRTVEPEYRGKLLSSLQGLVRDLSGMQSFFVDVGVEKPSDLAILDLALPTQPDGEPQQLFDGDRPFFVRALVQATGKEVNTGLSFRIGTKTILQDVTIPAGERQTVTFEVDPKELGLGPGQHSAEVHAKSTDQLPFNNGRYVTFGIREPRRVLVLAEEPSKAASFVDALWAFDFTPELVRLDDPKSTNLLGYQAVYLFAAVQPSAQLWTALEDYVAKGGGLGIVPPGKEMDEASYHTGPAQRLLPGKITSLVERKDEGAEWNFEPNGIYQHPLLQPFRAWRDSKKYDIFLQPRRATRYWAVKPKTPESVLVTYADEDRHPALLERTIDSKGRAGKVILFTTTLDPRQPEWNNYLESLHSFYPILVGLTTNYLAGDSDKVQLNFLTGKSEPRVTLPLGPRYQRYLLRGPNVFAEVAPGDGSAELLFPQAASGGNYTVDGLPAESNRFTARFSVNVPAEESDLTRVPVAEIEAVLGAGSVLPADHRAPIRTLLQDHWSEPLELFPPLMVALLLVLALENLLANKFYRKDPTPA